MSSRFPMASVCCALLVMAGTAGLVSHLDGGNSASAGQPGQGAFWRLLDRDERLVSVAMPSEGLHLGPGQQLALVDRDESGQRLRELQLTLRRGGRQSSSVDLSLREQAGGAYQIKVVPGDPLVAFLSLRQAGGRSVELARAERPGWLTDRSAPFELQLTLDGPRIGLALDGRQLLSVRDDSLAEGRTVLRADGIDVLALAATIGSDTSGRPAGMRTMRDDFSAFAAPAGGIDPLSAVLALGLALVLSCGWLASLCQVPPPPGRIIEAALRFLALPALVLTACLLRELNSVALGVVVALAALVGLAPALLHLRHSLGASGDNALATDAGSGPWLRVTLVLVSLGLWVGASAGFTRAESMRPVQQRQLRSLVGLASVEYQLPSPKLLDLGNALTIPGPYHGTLLETRFTLESNSLLEIRLRSQDRVAEGVALLLSSDARVASGWHVERDASFGLLGRPAPVLEPGRSYGLTVTATNNRFTARLDGDRFASAMEPDAPSGAVLLLAPAGVARIDELTVRPAPGLPAPLDIKAQGIRAALTPILALLMLMVVAGHVLRQPLLRVAEPLAYAWVPIALACARAEPAGHLSWMVWFAGAAATLPLLIVPALVLPGTVGRGRRLFFILVALLAGPAALTATLGPPERADRADGPAYEDFAGRSLTAGLTHFEHPLVRRFNSWLRDHRFRGRQIPIECPPGTQRVLCIGSSSTWGHGLPEGSGLDWPAQLQQRLETSADLGAVQVINGAIRGTTSGRMLFFLEEVLLRWHPDLIIVDFGFNDAGSLSILDDRAWLQEVAADDYDNGPLRKLDTWWQRTNGEALLARLWKSEPTVDGETARSWKHLAAGLDRLSPAEALERNLRTMGELAASIGAELILVKEPLRDDVGHLWKKEFSRVMDRVGRDLAATVVEPGPTMAEQGGTALFIDLVHLSPAGNHALATILEPAVTRVLLQREQR